MPRLTSHVDSLPGPLGEARAISTAGGGTALSTSAVLIIIPNGTTHLQILPRNFTTAVVAKLAINPYLAVLVSNDAFAAAPVDNSDLAQNGLSASRVTLSALTTLVLGGAVYIGAHLPFRGLRTVTVGANANASVLAATYWNGTAWTSLAPTDGTASGGATFAISGDITWTVPAAWVKQELWSILASLNTPVPCGVFVDSGRPLYWTRLAVSAALSATVTLSSLLALARSTAYAELPATMGLELRVSKQLGGQATLEALTDAGTGNLIVNGFTQIGGAF